MVYKVLIVEDSGFFQQRLTDIINLHPQLEVVGVASNGQEAVELDKKLKPDIISMDYEMPYMDGVSAVRLIMEARPVPIVMFSSMTYEGAKITLDALDAGAVDFIPKNFAEVSNSSGSLTKKLHETFIGFAKQGVQKPDNSINLKTEQTESKPATAEQPAAAEKVFTAPKRASSPVGRVKKLSQRPKVIVIGASTGGPVAVAEIISKLPQHFPVPVVIVQHMPPNFTRAFAERLNRQCHFQAQEAQSGDRISPGKILIAPGGHQLMFDGRNIGAIKIIAGDERVVYKPSVDIAFASAANVFGREVLGIVLTGMGSDGCEGAQLLKQKGATIWTQDEASCVVYGMPRAVDEASVSDASISIRDFGNLLAQAV